MSAGARFWQALDAEKPLQVVGAINAYSALLAERAGFRAIYLSGAGVANASPVTDSQEATCSALLAGITADAVPSQLGLCAIGSGTRRSLGDCQYRYPLPQVPAHPR